MKKKKKIALIELTSYHEECLYSQIQFLIKGNYELTLILNPKNNSNIQFYGIPKKNIILYNPRSSSFIGKRIANWFSLYQFIIKSDFKKIVFNTASSNKEVIALTKFLPKRIKCYGIIHNLKKLNRSTSQKIVSQRITEYYVLNDFLTNSADIENDKIKFSSFYPIFFPQYDSEQVPKNNNEIWICIPGELNYKRRDYEVILKALSYLAPTNHLKIILLGKMDSKKPDTIQFLKHAEQLGLLKYFVTFDNFIPNTVFHEYIKKSEYIMAPVSLTEQNYLAYKITGAYNLAFAYKKPLICPVELEVIPDLKETSHFYKNPTSLSQLFKKISENYVNKKISYDNPKWSFTEQQKNYLNLLET
ncbi:hypothetical protein BFP77_10480 [Maribacter sp. 4U21]|uniref:hypothetical protein n=1 Tax=Maribacter sp. 4U21 TaxID=1889779 RepID=UPI000C158B1A|nr:hypothetical protein [Maribacter sp. 4U21]PIB28069.1 hypothetical protein BFP77_10480 [Maribacter sp. 4U21]